MKIKHFLERNSFLYLIFFFLLTFLSCKKFLDIKPDNSVFTPSSLSEMQALLDDSDRMNDAVTPSIGHASSDNLFINEQNYNATTLLRRLVYIWEPREYYASNDWSRGYNAIFNSNYVLDGLKNIKETSENHQVITELRGTAYFYRAYYLLNLAWIYSNSYDANTSQKDLGIVLRENSDPSVESKRASVLETYQSIIRDAEMASQYLPVNVINTRRPSKAAAYGLLARIYLSMRIYDKANEYADRYLGLRNTLLDYNSSEVKPTTNVPFPINNPEVVFFTSMNTFNNTMSGSNVNIDTLLYKSYSDNDLRKTAFFRTNGNYWRFKGTYTANASRLFTGIATDEILLIRAECRGRLGKRDEALSDINRLMKSRWKNTSIYIPFSASTDNEVLAKILEERRKELVSRGLRWSDIKRLNKEGRNILLKRFIGNKEYILNPNDPRYAQPLPTDLIQNSSLPQNPNW